MLAIYTHDTWHIYIAIYASAVARGAKPSCHIEIKQDVIMIRRAYYSISFRTTPAGRQESRCAANSDPTMTPSLPPMDLICGLGVCQQPLRQVAGPGPHSRSWTWTWHDRRRELDPVWQKLPGVHHLMIIFSQREVKCDPAKICPAWPLGIDSIWPRLPSKP
jgi:hypothetical protein